MRTELSMHFIASGSHLTVQNVHRVAQAELGMFCKVNEEITSSDHKILDLGIELKLDSFSPHMLSLSVVGTIFFCNISFVGL